MKITDRFIKTALLSASTLLSPHSLAAAINPEVQPLGSIGPLELSTTDLTNGATAYRGWFENGAWQGDLIQYTIDKAGKLSTSIDLTALEPKQTTGGTNWSARLKFSDTAATGSHWKSGRKIITMAGGSQVAFRWDKIDANYKNQLDSQTPVDGASYDSPVLNFLRGERTNEFPAGAMRTRFSVMGDVIHSNPEYVGESEDAFVDSAYIAFKNKNLTREPRVYVGANDGMLHAFNATSGKTDSGLEVWAYVPSMLTPKLSILAGKPYAHRYFVDGAITVQDAYSDGAWHTVLVGNLGAGGKGLYALDVSNADLSSETDAAGTNKKVMWEEAALKPDGSAANSDIGYIFDATTVTQMNDGKWYAIFGNGIASANGVAKLMLKEIRTNGANPAAIAITTGSGGDNGLSAPALVDTNNDGKADIAWAGDINGDMWRFDLKGTGPWTKAYKVFDGSPGQPITLAPDITNHPNFGHLVLFGTGKLYEGADVTDKTVQAIYGVWDKGTAPTPSTPALLKQPMSGELTYSDITSASDELVRTFTTIVAVDYSQNNGWYVELPAGQRVLTPPQLRGGRVKSTVADPDGYTNWFLEVTFDDGSVADNSIFDLNQDTFLDEKDRVFGNNDTDRADPEDIPMAWKRPDGNMSQVTIANLEAGYDTLYLNFQNPPLLQEPCTGVCDGGFEGGHVDVDTDLELGDETNKHTHQYDDKTGLTYIDYVDISAGQNNIKDSGIGNSEDFIVLITNADYSPGGIIVLNKQEYNVVEYQRMIHKALAVWDGYPAPLTDPDNPGGPSLVFNLDQIMADGGTVRNSFDSLAIVAGGLIPTVTGCVKSHTDPLTNGRWRGGALTIQVVQASHFLEANIPAGQTAVDLVRQLLPLDHHDVVPLSDGTQVVLTEGGIQYGGLVAKDDAEFIYESTLFWHWNGEHCYKKDRWEEAYIELVKGISEEIYLEMLEAAGFTSFEDLVRQRGELEECISAGSKDAINSMKARTDLTKQEKQALETELRDAAKRCAVDLADTTKLYELGLKVEQANNGGGDGSAEESGGGLSGEPILSPGGIDPPGKTRGPNFESGRRTWIDILPQ